MIVVHGGVVVVVVVWRRLYVVFMWLMLLAVVTAVAVGSVHDQLATHGEQRENMNDALVLKNPGLFSFLYDIVSFSGVPVHDSYIYYDIYSVCLYICHMSTWSMPHGRGRRRRPRSTTFDHQNRG